MGKYTVTHSCGHEESLTLYGPMKERDRRILDMAQTPCDDCAAKLVTAAASETGLPALRGTAKQILWATDIRTRELPRWMAEADAAKRHLDLVTSAMADEARIAVAIAKSGKTREQLEELFAKETAGYRATIDRYEQAAQQTSAQWWIEHR